MEYGISNPGIIGFYQLIFCYQVSCSLIQKRNKFDATNQTTLLSELNFNYKLHI